VSSFQVKIATVALASLFTTLGAVAESLVIANADIETMTDKGRLIATDILIIDGIIQKIGKNLPASDIRVVDAQGMRVTPGVFNAFTQMGIVEIGGIKQTRDSSVDSEVFSASLNVVDAFNPHSTLIPQNRIHGVTQVVVAPTSSTSLFAGTVSVVNMSGSPADSIERSPVGVLVNYNEFAQESAGGSRAAALARIRNALADAREFSGNKDLYMSGEGRDLSLSFDDLDALAPVLGGQQYLFVNVSRSADILRVLELGDAFNIKLILVGAQEGWMVAKEIAKAAAAAIIDPTDNLPIRFETLGARLENAAMLHEAGVTLMFTGMEFQNTHNSYLVTQLAGNAVANGLPYKAALEAIFTNPARVFELDKSGQIEVGQIADLVLWNGDPLEVVREAQLVMVDGRETPMVSRATRLRDRYFERLKSAKAL